MSRGCPAASNLSEINTHILRQGGSLGLTMTNVTVTMVLPVSEGQRSCQQIPHKAHQLHRGDWPCLNTQTPVRNDNDRWVSVRGCPVNIYKLFMHTLLALLTCVNDVRCMSSRRRWCSVRVGEGRVERDPASRRIIREGGSVQVACYSNLHKVL